MSVEVDATEVYKALREVKANVQRVESPALRKAGEYAQEKLRENTPYWDGKKSNGKRGSYMQEHAKDHVVTGSVKNGVQKTQKKKKKPVTHIIADEVKRRLGL